MMLRLLTLCTLIAAALLIGAACGNDDDDAATPTGTPQATATPADEGVTIGDLIITGPFARGAIDRGAVFFTVSNDGNEADALVGASSAAAASAELHETVTEGASTMMRPIERIEVPAGGEAVLEPGGLHVMLIDPVEELAMGDTVQVTLEFETAGTVEIEATVTSYNESSMPMDSSPSAMQ
jgi:copper(I)-binding protein